MSSPAAAHVQHIIMDEAQDVYDGHPECQTVYANFAKTCSKMKVQRGFFSGSHPPHLHKVFCLKAGVSLYIRVIRASTDRPELGYHVHTLPQSDITRWESLKHLAAQLQTQLQPEERIVVFFMSSNECDLLSKETGCAKYHSQLPNIGDTKAYNLDLWKRGEMSVLAGTTAFQQGVDYPYIAFVVYFEHAYGMIGYTQGAGRSGRRGRHAYVIILAQVNFHLVLPFTNKNNIKDVSCKVHFEELKHNVTRCYREMLLETMDGPSNAFTCLQIPGCNICGVCDPSSALAILPGMVSL
jgi:superfamily II DNA helicase RecQ